ncbi:efflux RND transporter periplasmic adaptor subunit [Marilutibacter alkalisoli]|uniref:HlyD family efflux transporter periplasmic adaptor subunit n=1 Tax=Marilutibacter alkalisoli TaxID=2591633 RepID=A0A514BS63_9GAMM|nr:HlyD family efflux transporter periplasmic adaptor subunit [Lysobacter alkalisoli]QDH70238.1 HlyD family efflux transporter periplasmic adaptor subunit [Lysobacter alkalisoli]
MPRPGAMFQRIPAFLRRFGFLKKRSVWLGGAVVLALLLVALWPSSTEVDLATVTTGELQVTVDEEGETRVRERYMVSAPVAGEIRRIELEPGDAVEAGRTVVARLRPSAPVPLDMRVRAEAEAAIPAAEAALARAEAERARAATVATRAQQQYERLHALQDSGAIARDAIDAQEAEAKAARDALLSAGHSVDQARHELAAVRARLIHQSTVTEEAAAQEPENASSARGGTDLLVYAPADGVVLRRLRESRGVVQAGADLLEIGDARRLEIVSDLLSSEAVRVSPGDAVLIEQWGGSDTLRGRVRRIEPAGFLKVSALGVEEQRVNVISDFEDPVEAREALGDAYRVEVRIVVWHKAEATRLPVGSLFREDGDWAVFVADAGRARLRKVAVGARNSREAEVLDGLDAGERVVLYPADDLRDGARIRPRGN